MKAVILKCRPNAQFHFGQIAIDVDTSLNDTAEHLHSDTLYSAIISTAARVLPEKAAADICSFEQFLQAFDSIGGQAPAITLSSAFYCLEMDGKYIYFLPKALHFNLFSTNAYKELKKIQYISAKIWQTGLQPDQWLNEKECVIIQGKFVCHRSELAEEIDTSKLKIYDIQALPKVAVHKPSSKDSLYYQTNIQIADNSNQSSEVKSHFFCLIKHSIPETDIRYKALKIMLNLLIDEGIGGERSVGCGQLEGMEIKDFDFELASNENQAYCCLSLLSPFDESEHSALRHYELITRGGRRTGRKVNDQKDEKLKRIKMIKEGAILDTPIMGAIRDIAPDSSQREYLRNGKCLALPINVK